MHERHKDKNVYENSDYSPDEIDVLFFVTDGFYNGGPFQNAAFEEATIMIGHANGDDIHSIDWKINLQTSFYATIYTCLDLSLTLSQDEIPEKCGWLFFVNCIHHMSDGRGGQRYHIKTSLDKEIDTINAFMDELPKYLLKDDVWQFGEDHIRIFEKGFAATTDKEQAIITEINNKLFRSDSKTVVDDALVITLPLGNSTFYLRFSINDLFDIYKTGGWNSIHKTISHAREPINSLNPENVTELLAKYETAQAHLILRPLNYSDNRRDLYNCIYTTVGDIALVLYFVVSDRDGKLYTTKVPADAFHSWNMDKSIVMENALLNNVGQAQPRIYTDVKDMENAPLMKGAFMAVDSGLTSLPSRGAILTTTRTQNGAIAAFYPGATDKIGALFQDDFYVIFTGTSEAWVHPKSSFSPRSLLLRLKDNNKMFPDGLLSRKVYLYSRSEKQLKPLEL